MSFRTDRVRLAFLVKRKSTLTEEEFSRYWSGTHSALFASLKIVKTNLIKYEQAHINQSALMQIHRIGGAPCEWDGMGTFEAESYAKIFEVFENEEYLRVVKPDEANYLARDECQLLPLDLLTVLEK
ncbi:hypothetical protein B0H17DRAFT_559331 [Mycena rosella]|uniref:EthD domain-containing protein n=1 Tax=Mycena rosella TaxID=1033263 RepID=A0AAD7GJ77_MYCRO|nr:hypothetical protein B0H17DRAFT_559331 [Mycena rosella]